MSHSQLDMFESIEETPKPIGGRNETFEEYQKRCRGALIYWLGITRIHSKPGQILIEGTHNGAWIDSWLIPMTQAGILEDLGGMAGIW